MHHVGIGGELQVVADANRGHHESHIRRDLAANQGYSAEQVATTVGVRQRDQAVADLDADRIDMQQVAEALGLLG